jgi:SH3-like domain-containing protein
MAPGFADEHFPFLAEVSKESVNVRAGPNTNFEKIDKLNKGTQVVVLGRSFEWYKVQPLSTIKEYIRSDYLKTEAGVDVAAVLGDNVNVRSSPNSNAASLGEIKKGALVKVLGQINGWSLLAPVAGTTAWIHQDFLKEISADVPASSLIQTVEIPVKTVPEEPLQTVIVSKTVTSSISLRGTLEPLAQSPRSDVHYEIVIDSKAVYYLQDIPQISFFANMVVDLEGAIVPDWQKESMYPLVHIDKISLVL